jgi:hypothetical protein
MSFRDFFNLLFKYLIFGLIIFLVVMKIPASKVAEKDNMLITLVSVAVFILLELFGGYFKKAKDVICGCSSNSKSDPLVI